MIDRLNQWMNRMFGILSMYHGMLFGLISIWVVALALSFFDVIPYEPLEMIVSLAVLFFATGLTSWFVGWLFGVEPHGLSSMITAFILALIFTPTLELSGLLVLALVGAIAAASKFVLAYRGRHIFNPAAIAAVIIALTGLGAASWWVATPPLTLIVLATILVSLYKSRQFGMALVFLATATSLLLIVFAVYGATPLEGLLLLLSWPLLFFAGVMLVEPLTLPPYRWQRYIEAIIVGVLFAIPFQVGWFEMSPEIALVIGNIFAALVATRRAIQLKFKERRSLTPTTDELVFIPSVPVDFIPGQFAEITIPHVKADMRGVRRSFSLTSLPNTNEVTFGIKYYEPSSSFKKALHQFKPNTSISVANVSGDFVLPNDTSKPLLFVAGGIGITPFISHLKAVQASSEGRDVVLVYTLSNAKELAYQELLSASNVQVHIISPTKPDGFPKNWHYSKGSRLTTELVEKILSTQNRRVAYISGPTPFVQTTRRLLRGKVRTIKTDYFVGY